MFCFQQKLQSLAASNSSAVGITYMLFFFVFFLSCHESIIKEIWPMRPERFCVGIFFYVISKMKETWRNPHFPLKVV